MTKKKKEKKGGKKKKSAAVASTSTSRFGDMETPPANLPHVVPATISRSRPLPPTRAL